MHEILCFAGTMRATSASTSAKEATATAEQLAEKILLWDKNMSDRALLAESAVGRVRT